MKSELSFIQDQAWEAELKTFPICPIGVVSFPVALLLSNVFAINGRAKAGFREVDLRPRCTEALRDFGRCTVRYKGPALSQKHKRVLLGLLERAAGTLADEDVVLTFDAEAFLRSMYSDASSRSVDRLMDVLSDLRAATFDIRWPGSQRASVFGFIKSAERSRREVVVQLDRRAVEALNTSNARALIPASRRNALADGVQTALADLIYASRAKSFTFKEVADLWEQDADVYARYIRQALPKLQAAGVLTSYEARRGRFSIVLAPLF